MRLSYTFFLSGSNLRRRKLRSVLTIGGMAVGISLVVFLVSLGFGLQKLVRGQIANVEALTVLDVSKGDSTLLALDDKTIEQFGQLNSVKDVSPSLSLSGQLAKGDSVTDIAIYGVVPDFLSLEGIKIDHGQGFSSEGAKELLVTSTALNLIGYENPLDAVDQTLTLKLLVPKKIEGSQEEQLVGTDVDVVVRGILQEDQELTLAYAPIKLLTDLGYSAEYSAAKVKVNNDKKEYDLAKIKVEDESQLPEVRRQIEAMGYQVDSIADTVGQIDKIFVIFELIVAGFGAIAMFVAAIGALNTLTVSLLERTREIGLMKTLGASSGDIYRLFLVESITIGITGGLIGVGLGYLGGFAANWVINLLATRLGGNPVDIFDTPPLFVAAVIVIVFLVSVVTGVYPARRAAKINPLDALRYE